ncbi:8178_t:CDS:1 [Acaulospora morrowiae]|uniref:8178_t:CDS:1 n=1 Tax=Acaulospora morrowiae TaxID=94023 RepID=A0A9N9CNM6_9GLOM|nr:8178_t:CDS:1 [Acaulospora morrowiae]
MMHLIKSTPMNTWINAPAAKQWSCTTMSHRKAVGRRKRLTEHIVIHQRRLNSGGHKQCNTYCLKPSEPYRWKFHPEYFEERHRIMMTVRRRKKVAKNEHDLRNTQPAIKERCVSSYHKWWLWGTIDY